MFYVIAFGGTAVAFATALFAWFKGDLAVRYGAAINFLGYISITAVQLAGWQHPLVPMVWADLLIACGFLWLAVRYNSLWLGAAMIMQGIEFAIHTLVLTSPESQPRIFGLRAYALGENLISLGIILTLVGATFATMHLRRSAGRRAIDEDGDIWTAAQPNDL
jgi:hypothetical protein